MRHLIIFLILLIVSVWVGVEIMRHPGYLLIVYHPWMVQMPIWFALISSVFFLVLFYLLIDSIDRLEFLWFRIKNWLRFRREHQSYSKTQQGLTTLIEERWKKAEYLLIGSVNQTVEPLMNYLGAAYAAHQQNALDRRDSYLQKAYQVAPRAELAIGLTQAQLELDQDQLEQASATLHHLQRLSPRHPRVLKLLEKVYVRLSDWQHLQALLPSLRKAKVLNAEQLQQFEKNIYCELLQAASLKNITEVTELWNSIPRQVKKNPDVVCAYVKQLLRFPNTQTEIEQLIRKTLKHHWQPELVMIYGTLFTADGLKPSTQTDVNLNRQLVVLGAWLKMYGPQPELLLTLGKVCVRIQLWGRAKDYFEKCLAQGPSPEASLEYGRLLEHLNEPEAALQQYRAGLERETPSLQANIEI